MSENKDYPKFVQKKLDILNGKTKLEPTESFKPGQYTIDDIPKMKKALDELNKSDRKK